MSEIVEVCVRVSDVLNGNGRVYTKDCLRKAAEDDPAKFWIKEKPDGRVELWSRAPFPASPLSSKEGLPKRPE